MFRLFADLIAKSLDAQRRLATTESALVEERTDRELREQFIAVLGHDLRGPMTSISRLTDLLLKTPLDEDAVTMVRLMRESASRLLALIDNLLDLARGRLSGGLILSRDGNEPLEAVLRAVTAELKVNHPDHVVETDFSLMDPINCDRARIAQMFSNLLSNALTYGSAEQPVLVRATSDGASFELSVANSGTPIPAGALEHLFHPFYRSNAAQSREGLGLGLYIAHEIAKAHGGTLAVESTEQETRFTFRMPAIR
jgi:signal transduction histidine kinase